MFIVSLSLATSLNIFDVLVIRLRLSLNQPPQQLPGLPQPPKELPQLSGLPQQLPGMFPMKSLLEEAVLWADISFARFLLLHDLQSSSSLFPKTKNSLISPQSPHLYS
jgi:hypothetical protein